MRKRRINNMDRQTLIQNITSNYRKRGITENIVNGLIDSGLQAGLNYDLIYLSLKSQIGKMFGEEFFCTPDEIAKALEVPVERVYKMVEEAKEELIAAGENPDDYFQQVPVSRFMM